MEERLGSLLKGACNVLGLLIFWLGSLSLSVAALVMAGGITMFLFEPALASSDFQMWSLHLFYYLVGLLFLTYSFAGMFFLAPTGFFSIVFFNVAFSWLKAKVMGQTEGVFGEHLLREMFRFWKIVDDTNKDDYLGSERLKLLGAVCKFFFNLESNEDKQIGSTQDVTTNTARDLFMRAWSNIVSLLILFTCFVSVVYGSCSAMINLAHPLILQHSAENFFCLSAIIASLFLFMASAFVGRLCEVGR